MAAAKNRIGARQPEFPASGNTPPEVPNIDAAWVAQAIEARKLAFRLYRLHLQEDVTSVLPADVYCSSVAEDATKLMEDYLTANEKLFDLAAALTAEEHTPKSQIGVDNSNNVATVGHLLGGRIEE
jgi:hypothetical protein